MGIIVGFGALNLDLIFEVEDFKSISSNDGNLGSWGRCSKLSISVTGLLPHYRHGNG